MKKGSKPFEYRDIAFIKWEAIMTVVAISIAAGVIILTDNLNTEANNSLRRAQSNYDQAQQSVNLIEEEEATILEYIDRFQEIMAKGIINEEDRLQLIEEVANLRSEHALFPINVNIQVQTGVRLLYDPAETDPGEPIDLKTSVVELSFPLLHEEDLVRILEGIVSSGGLFQIKECEIRMNDETNINFLVLSQHLGANCALNWYTFDLDPQPDQQQQQRNNGFLGF